VAEGRPALSLATAVGVLLTVLGALAVASPLSDSSFFTHLATGRIIWNTGIPRTDPYTFTAAGRSWVVQSWLASWLYAGLEKLGGLEAVRLVVTVTGAAIAACIWALSRPAQTLSARLLVAAPVVLMGFRGWAERPLLFGLLCLAWTLLVAEGRAPAWSLLPVVWLWVNMHGSWPLGGVLLVLLALGRRLDKQPAGVELRALAWYAGGVLLGVLNPYGIRLLTFPVELLSKREALSELREWRPPTYSGFDQQLFVVVVAIALVALARRRSWRAGLPLVVFVIAAVTSSRNVVPASVVLVPGAAYGLRGWGTVSGTSTRLARPVAAVGVALGVVIDAVVVTGDPVDDSLYPRGADRWLRTHDLSPVDHRVIAREAVGNWWELLDGPTQNIFIDDRVEVIPISVVRDHAALLDGAEGWQEILERYDAEAVLWQADEELADLLADDPGWEIVYHDDDWVVAAPR
jgi:hypothetical protein